MKVSIITLYGANNVGAFLQAFSLQEVVSSITGADSCSFVHFPGKKAKQDSKIKKAVRYLKKLKVRKVLFKYKTSQKYQQSGQYLRIDKAPFSENRKYDTVIVGSDEVWNVASKNFTHHQQYFAKNLKADNIIAYAPSAGSTDASTARSRGTDFSGFRYLSARDQNTCELVREMDGRTPVTVCDPTLLIDSFDPYLQQVKSPDRKNYILVYSYGLEKDETAKIRKFARAHKKRLISVGTYNSWCHENIVVDPFEFLRWLQHADMVITSTFHGAVLSVKLHKQMAVYAGSEKIKSFLKQMGLEDRDLFQKSLSEVFAEQIPYDVVEEKLGQLRETSMAYLKGALENNGY